MSRENPPITAMGALIDALYCEYHDRKYRAVVEYYPPGTCRVIEYFDSGQGHSSAITESRSVLDPGVFEEALKLGYITGLLKPGYVSKNEFKLTETTGLRHDAFQIMRKWQKEDYARRVAERLQEKVPLEYRGLLFEEALRCYLEGNQEILTELRFAQTWSIRNKNNGIESFLSELLTPYDVSPRKELVPATSREWDVANLTAATLIQWLGSPAGIRFLEGAVANTGGTIKITFPTPSSSD